MTDEEKKQKMNEYSQLCAKIGDLETTRFFIEKDLTEFRDKAATILQELRNVQKPIQG